jgi:hypothetical protein
VVLARDGFMAGCSTPSMRRDPTLGVPRLDVDVEARRFRASKTVDRELMMGEVSA